MKQFIYTGTDKKLSRILENLPENFSYSHIQKLLRKGEVKIDGVRTKKDLIVSNGAEICVYYVENAFSPDIVFENELILVCNKPVSISSEEYAEKLRFVRPSAVLAHRLDTNTSGLLLFAQNQEIFERLKKAFSEHKIEKHYVVEVFGKVEKGYVFSDYLVKIPQESRVKIFSKAVPSSFPVITEIKPIKTGEKVSLCDVEIVTGKTHQIRAHLAFHGFPVVGDGKYGNEKENKNYKTHIQHLRSVRLTFHTAEDDHLYALNGLTVRLDNYSF